MKRPITLMTGQWADMSLEDICRTASEMGYEGLELACWGHIDLEKAAASVEYCEEIKKTLASYNLGCWAIATHLTGQCVGDDWDERLDGFAPSHLAGKPQDIRAWAIQQMMLAPKAAKNMGVDIVTGFVGSPIWKMWYSFPQTSEEQVEAGFARIKELWTPILDEFDAYGVKFALEVHPTEIAFDYYSTKKLLEVFDYREAFGINFDPSHLVWQGVNPTVFLMDFAKKVYHVHVKDAVVKLDGRAGILGSHITFGDMRRGWNFVSPGHGDVNFDEIIRVLNENGYDGPLSVEWEDSGMNREYGAKDACTFVHKIDFAPSDIAFDAAFEN